MDGEGLYYSGRVLWVVKSGDRLYGKVLDDYPYYVEVNGDSSFCTCPLGGNCEHVRAVKIAYERGFYFDCPDEEPFGEGCAYSMLNSVPELRWRVLLRELEHALETDESGSDAAKLFYEAFNILGKDPDARKLTLIGVLLNEYSALFPDYALTERLKSEFQRLKIRSVG